MCRLDPRLVCDHGSARGGIVRYDRRLQAAESALEHASQGVGHHMADIAPSEIERVGHEELHITWEDGRRSRLQNRRLRLECPCAGCVDEMSGARTLDPESVPEEIWPTSIELVGHYAISIVWSDAHATGIFTYERLREMSQES